MVLLSDVAARASVLEDQLRATLAALGQQVWSGGRQLLLGGEGMRYVLGDPGTMPAGEALERALDATFEREPVRVEGFEGFEGFRLLPRR